MKNQYFRIALRVPEGRAVKQEEIYDALVVGFDGSPSMQDLTQHFVVTELDEGRNDSCIPTEVPNVR